MSHKYENRTRKIKDRRWNSKNLLFHLLENSQETISLRFDRHISSQDSFGHRLSLFSKLLCLVHKGERISSLFSRREGKMQSSLWSSNRSSVIIHRKSYIETKFTSGGVLRFSFIRDPLATMTLLKLLNEKGRGMENEVIEGQPIFECRAFFNLHNVSFREIPLDVSRIRRFVTRYVCVYVYAIFVINLVEIYFIKIFLKIIKKLIDRSCDYFPIKSRSNLKWHRFKI